jgi:hypothetical protein
MKLWRLPVAVALAVAAVLLMASLVFAAPASRTSVQTSQVFDSPILTGTVPIVTSTVQLTHPVGIAIALYFNIPYTQVMSLHAQGVGFGTIARAYLMALASGGVLSPTQLLEMHQAGVGWGQIKKDYGVPPGGNGLGTIMGNKHTATQPEPVAPAAQSVKKNKGGSTTCPGNSCNAPGQQKTPKVRTAKPH